MNGTWTATGGTIYVPTGQGDLNSPFGADWPDETSTNSAFTRDTNTSYINFVTAEYNTGTNGNVNAATGLVTGSDGQTVQFGRNGAGQSFDATNLYWDNPASTYLQGVWQGTGLAANKNLAFMYVTPGTNLTFTGQITLSPTSGSASSEYVTFTTTPAPEPSSLVLLASGLIGLAAYAWKKRK
jgi:hypothetical protein